MDIKRATTTDEIYNMRDRIENFYNTLPHITLNYPGFENVQTDVTDSVFDIEVFESFLEKRIAYLNFIGATSCLLEKGRVLN